MEGQSAEYRDRIATAWYSCDVAVYRPQQCSPCVQTSVFHLSIFRFQRSKQHGKESYCKCIMINTSSRINNKRKRPTGKCIMKLNISGIVLIQAVNFYR